MLLAGTSDAGDFACSVAFLLNDLWPQQIGGAWPNANAGVMSCVDDCFVALPPPSSHHCSPVPWLVNSIPTVLTIQSRHQSNFHIESFGKICSQARLLKANVVNVESGARSQELH